MNRLHVHGAASEPSKSIYTLRCSANSPPWRFGAFRSGIRCTIHSKCCGSFARLYPRHIAGCLRGRPPLEVGWCNNPEGRASRATGQSPRVVTQMVRASTAEKRTRHAAQTLQVDFQSGRRDDCFSSSRGDTLPIRSVCTAWDPACARVAGCCRLALTGLARHALPAPGRRRGDRSLPRDAAARELR